MMDLMNKLKDQLPKLHCTQDSKCWCNQLSYRFPMTQEHEKCKSPREILSTVSDLSAADKKYLESLLLRVFVQ